METKETRVYKGKQYTVVDKYEVGLSRFIHDGTDIAILERNGKYFIQNYEGMDLFMGPYEHAVKTGDNGEILVKDIGKDYYYVPGIKKEKPFGIGFLKEYHPEYHYKEPYTYSTTYSTAARMMDGSLRIKHSDGRLESESYRYYYDTGVVQIYEDMDGHAFGRAYDLRLPLEHLVRPDDPRYPGTEVPSYAILEAYGLYKKNELSLDQLPYNAFLNDNFLRRVLEEEKKRAKQQIFAEVDSAVDTLGGFARYEDLDRMAEVDVDETAMQERLNKVAAVIVAKRKVAVQEVERREALARKEEKARYSVERVLDFDSIVKKSKVKPRKKKPEEGAVGKIDSELAGGEELGE